MLQFLFAVIACASAYVAQDIDCLQEPWLDECKDYKYDAFNSDLDNLCGNLSDSPSVYSVSNDNLHKSLGMGPMSDMPGCSLRKMCESVSSNDVELCHPMSILADICVLDMPGMPGCHPYRNLCHPKNHQSSVKQCTEHLPLHSFTKLNELAGIVKSMCNIEGHSMTQCTANSKCHIAAKDGGSKNCNLLGMYVSMCQDMDMPGCDKFQEWCVDGAPLRQLPGFCSVDQALPTAYPPMKMYFHTGEFEFILFKDWVPRSSTAYWLSLIMVMVLAVACEFIGIARFVMDMEETKVMCAFNDTDQGNDSSQSSDEGCSTKAGGDSEPLLPNSVYIARQQRVTSKTSLLKYVVKFSLILAETTISYALMLVAMTFNVGLFIAVVVGLSIGSMLAGKLRLRLGMVYQSQPHGIKQLADIKRRCGC